MLPVKMFLGVVAAFFLLLPVCQAEIYHEHDSQVAIIESNIRSDRAKPFAEIGFMIVKVPGSEMAGLSLRLPKSQFWNYLPAAVLQVDKTTTSIELFDSLYQSKSSEFRNILTGRSDLLTRCESSGDFLVSPAAVRQLSKAKQVVVILRFLDKPDLTFKVPDDVLTEWQQVIKLADKA